MCGNGVRCIAKYVYDYGLTDKTFVSLETKAGIKYLDMTVKDGKVSMVKVDMGAPITNPSDIPAVSDKEIIVSEPVVVDGKEYKITCVSMGNPHGVLFVDDTTSIEIEKIGPKFEHHEMFPDRANIEFIQVVDRSHIKMRVWERGAGETLACGTGTCASVYACILNGLTDNSVDVEVLGGTIHIDYDEEKNTIFMTGPAAVSFDGEINL
jgi:diaminopimelate epimerase